MTRLLRRYVDGPFGQIHLTEVGHGPPVLLLHQTPRSADEFREVMELLADRCRLIAMDLPGMGGSDAPADPARIEHYGDAAAAVIESEFDSGPVAVCGHHTGGVVAIDLAARYPLLVERLILSSTPWVDAAARTARAQKVPIDTVQRTEDGAHLLSLWSQRAPFYQQSVALLDRFMTDALRSEDPANGHLAVGLYEMETAVQAIDCAVTIVEHSRDPFASKHTRDLQHALPGAEVRHIADGGVALEATGAAFASVLAESMRVQTAGRRS